MEELLVQVSALQHYVFCPRQCALIYLEGVWEDNIYTLRGHRAHKNVDIPQELIRGDITIELALPLWSERLKLVGKADVVEFIENRPYPVEHKVGKLKYRLADEVQLCAQALCLEEMFSCEIPEGALYYRRSRRRVRIPFTPSLRETTEKTVSEVRRLLSQRTLPPAAADERCRHCSLSDVCLPLAETLLEETAHDSHAT